MHAPVHTGKMLELDLHVKPVGDLSGALALMSMVSHFNKLLISLIDVDEEGMGEGGSGFLEKNLSDFFDIQIFSTVYFGSKQEPHQLIFDTGSSWLWVQTPECQTCATTNDFRYRDSNTFRHQSEDVAQVSYGSGTIWGYRSTDDVCLGDNRQ